MTGHPRGCGEQFTTTVASSSANGSSPRVRGTVAPASDGCGQFRVIPAGAGNRCSWPGFRRINAGHPRGCGEQIRARCAVFGNSGSSPRVRGTEGQADVARDPVRVIPAGAGNSARRVPRHGRGSGHPRGCGEQASRSIRCTSGDGSSPRVRGTAVADPVARLGNRVIPAGAGNRAQDQPRRSQRRVIPADAGNRTRRSALRRQWAGHPRGCGEQWRQSCKRTSLNGSSPRVRGTVVTS